jgi:hypothetical protein
MPEDGHARPIALFQFGQSLREMVAGGVACTRVFIRRLFPDLVHLEGGGETQRRHHGPVGHRLAQSGLHGAGASSAVFFLLIHAPIYGQGIPFVNLPINKSGKNRTKQNRCFFGGKQRLGIW